MSASLRFAFKGVIPFVVPALALCLAAGAWPASASGHVVRHAMRPGVTTSHTQKYGKSWLWKTTHLHLCVTFTVKGTFTFRTTTGRGNVQWTHQRLKDPFLRLSFANLSNGACGKPAVPRKVEMQQHWTGYSCSFNPSISLSVGAPASVSISVSGWPSCGNRKQAVYATSPPYDGKSYYNQYNSGSPTAFGNFTGYTDPEGKTPHPCYGVFPSATIYRGTNSDSFGAGNLSNSKSVCLGGP
jgi:hypothetical protein